MKTLTAPKLRQPPAALVDANGQPFPRGLVALPNPRGMQTYNANPVVGLTVENIVAYYRSAEFGAPTRQMDMFDNLNERLPEMEGMFEERNDHIAGCDFSIVPPPDRNDKPSRLAAAKLNEFLQHNVATAKIAATKSQCPSTNFRAWLEHQGTSVPFGYACTNMMWDLVEGFVVPVLFEPIAARRFGAPSGERANEIWLIDGTMGMFKLVELEMGLWSVTRRRHRNPYAAGLMRGCSWWAFFALTGFKNWQIFAEMFGLPLAIGYYEEGAGKVSREKLEEAVRSIGQDGYAVLSALTELVIKETARGGDGSMVYPLIFETALQQIRKRITGGSLNTDTGTSGVGSYNAATVHESRAFQMKRRDATRLEDEFADSIGKWFNIWNGFDRAGVPRLKLKIARDELARAQALEIIGMAMPLSKQQAREEFNLREPVDKDDEMTWTPTVAPDPNRQRPEKKS